MRKEEWTERKKIHETEEEKKYQKAQQTGRSYKKRAFPSLENFEFRADKPQKDSTPIYSVSGLLLQLIENPKKILGQNYRFLMGSGIVQPITIKKENRSVTGYSSLRGKTTSLTRYSVYAIKPEVGNEELIYFDFDRKELVGMETHGKGGTLRFIMHHYGSAGLKGWSQFQKAHPTKLTTLDLSEPLEFLYQGEDKRSQMSIIYSWDQRKKLNLEMESPLSLIDPGFEGRITRKRIDNLYYKNNKLRLANFRILDGGTRVFAAKIRGPIQSVISIRFEDQGEAHVLIQEKPHFLYNFSSIWFLVSNLSKTKKLGNLPLGYFDKDAVAYSMSMVSQAGTPITFNKRSIATRRFILKDEQGTNLFAYDVGVNDHLLYQFTFLTKRKRILLKSIENETIRKNRKAIIRYKNDQDITIFKPRY